MDARNSFQVSFWETFFKIFRWEENREKRRERKKKRKKKEKKKDRNAKERTKVEVKKIWWKFCFINHVTKTFDQEYKFKKLFPTLIVSYKGLLEHIDYQETFLEVKNIKVEKSFWKFFTQETFLKVKKFQELYSNLKKVYGNMNY